MRVIENNKVFILVDNCIWDYEECTKIVAVSSNKDDIKQIMNKYIEKIKKDIDFENLDIAENDSDCGCIVEENDNSFSVYVNGEYNNNHIEIYIEEKKLVTYKEYENKDESYEI